MKFTITIALDDSSIHAVRKALAITRTSSILDSVEKFNIGQMKMKWGSRWRAQFPIIFSPTLFTLTKAIPAMRHLHTVRLFQTFLPRTYFYCILSSPHITYLILESIYPPEISTSPPPLPPTLRKLTIIEVHSWRTLEPLIALVATSLEYLEFQCCNFLFHNQCEYQYKPPSFSCLHELRELRHYQRNCSWFGNAIVLRNLLQLGPQVTQVHIVGTLWNYGALSPPKSLRHLSTDNAMLRTGILGVDPWSQLMSLTIHSHSLRRGSRHLNLALIIRHYFPRITSLHLHIPWSLRNFALIMARSQENVQALELFIIITRTMEWGETGGDEVEISADYLRTAILPAALRSIKLDVYDKTDWGIGPCTRWVNDNIIPDETGLGGPDLRSIELSFIQPESGSERERVLRRRRWIKSPNDDWQIEG